MTPTLWLQCACNPNPIHVATRTDITRLTQIRETLERQLRGENYPCGLSFTGDDRDMAGVSH